MELISTTQFLELIQDPNVQILKKHDLTQAPKVLTFANKEIIKLFYPKKKWLTSNYFIPRAQRFIKNAKLLKGYSVVAPDHIHLSYCAEYKIFILRYPKIQGEDVRTRVKKGAQNILKEVMLFIASLHEKGIFFRSIHLGNLISHHNQTALIDIADVRFKNKPLNYLQRLRNLKHLLLNEDDKPIWKSFGFEQCLKIYFKQTTIPVLIQKLIIRKFLKLEHI